MAATTRKSPARGQKKVTLSKPPENEEKKPRTPRKRTAAKKPAETADEKAAPATKKTTAKKPVAKKATAKKTTAKKPVAKKATATKAPAKKATAKKPVDDNKLHRGYIIRYVHTVTEEDGTEVENLDYITAHDKFHYDIAVAALKESFGLDVESDKVRVGRIDLLRSECDVAALMDAADDESPEDEESKE